MGYKLKTAATSQPVSITEARDHLKADSTADNAYILRLIEQAVEWVEKYTNRQINVASWYLYLDKFPTEINLDICPVREMEGINYYNTNNDLNNFTDYDADLVSEPARIMPSYGNTFPVVYNRPNAVIISFSAGYDDVPEAIKQAILLIVGHDYENRGDEGHRKYPKAVYDKLDMYRLF